MLGRRSGAGGRAGEESADGGDGRRGAGDVGSMEGDEDFPPSRIPT
jgi:hypothetical protein